MTRRTDPKAQSAQKKKPADCVSLLSARALRSRGSFQWEEGDPKLNFTGGSGRIRIPLDCQPYSEALTVRQNRLSFLCTRLFVWDTFCSALFAGAEQGECVRQMWTEGEGDFWESAKREFHWRAGPEGQAARDRPPLSVARSDPIRFHPI